MSVKSRLPNILFNVDSYNINFTISYSKELSTDFWIDLVRPVPNGSLHSKCDFIFGKCSAICFLLNICTLQLQKEIVVWMKVAGSCHNFAYQAMLIDGISLNDWLEKDEIGAIIHLRQSSDSLIQVHCLQTSGTEIEKLIWFSRLAEFCWVNIYDMRMPIITRFRESIAFHPAERLMNLRIVPTWQYKKYSKIIIYNYIIIIRAVLFFNTIF